MSEPAEALAVRRAITFADEEGQYHLSFRLPFNNPAHRVLGVGSDWYRCGYPGYQGHCGGCQLTFLLVEQNSMYL